MPGFSFFFFPDFSLINSDYLFTCYPLTDILFVAFIQIEGEANKSGRGPSVWDTFTHKTPGIFINMHVGYKNSLTYANINYFIYNFTERILDRSNGDVAVDFYHRYKVYYS